MQEDTNPDLLGLYSEFKTNLVGAGKNSSVVESTGCSPGGSGFNSLHPHGSAELSGI